jgi:L-ribulose-5-phosphate 3-epimerase
MVHARIGIMQGRLSPPEGSQLQSFPRNSWREEFARARQVGIDYIEWIFDDHDGSANPIRSKKGRETIRQLKDEYGIGVPAICMDWLIDYPLIRCDSDARRKREDVLHQLLHWGQEIGVSRVVLPFIDASSIRTEQEKATAIQVLNTALPIAKRIGVELHIEADFNPADFKAFLDRVDDPSVRVNYDSGNSSGLGYSASEEFKAYGSRIGSIHIKDRLRKEDGTVESKPLGGGSAKFDDVFANIRKIGYTGGFTLQAARDREGDEINWIKKQAAFIQRYWNKE